MDELVERHALSVRQACDQLGLARSGYYYRIKPRNDHEVIAAIRDYLAIHPQHGLDKVIPALKRQGYPWNHKRIRRVYCTLGLCLPRRGKKRLPQRVKRPLVAPEKPNQCWSMDFMSDCLRSGRRFRTFNVLDDFNRAILGIEIDTSLPSQRIIATLNRLVEWHGKPRTLRMDNGPEFLSHTLQRWAQKQAIFLQYIQPGKPTQNAYIERFNRSYRTEVLDPHLFSTIQEVQEVTEQWIYRYNYQRTHEALRNVPPMLYTQHRLD